MNKPKEMAAIPYKITKEGSLGVLALGAVGVKAWRKVKLENEQDKK